MPSASVRNVRKPLHPVTNLPKSPSLTFLGKSSHSPAKSPQNFENHTLLIPTVKEKRASMPGHAIPSLLETKSDTVNPSQMSKKQRTCLGKRVSFVELPSAQFSTPNKEPSKKIAKSDIIPSPLARRSPRLSGRPALAEEGEDETNDTVDLPHMPSAPPISPPSATNDALSLDGASPPAPCMESIAKNDRRSIGLFFDEHVNQPEWGVNRREGNEELTQAFNSGGAGIRPRCDSMASVLSDGDITQSIVGFMGTLLHGKDSPPPPNSDDSPMEYPNTNDNSNSFVPSNAIDNSPGLPMINIGNDTMNLNAVPETENSAQTLDTDHSTVEAPSTSSKSQDIRPIVPPSENIDRVIPENSHNGFSNSPNIPVVEPQVVAATLLPKSFVLPVVGNQRNALPNRRKLFDSDFTDGEETLHFQEPAEKDSLIRPVGTETSSSIRNILNVLQTKDTILATPRTDGNSNVGAGVEGRASARASARGRRDAASQLRELSNSGRKNPATQSSLSDKDEVADLTSSAIKIQRLEGLSGPKELPSTTSFTMSDFLKANMIHFKEYTTNTIREASIQQDNIFSPVFKPSSVEDRMNERVRKKSVLNTLRKEIQRMKDELKNVENSCAAYEREVEASNPPIFAEVAKIQDYKCFELTTSRLNMKRLKKISAIQTRQEWVSRRKVWERKICNDINSQVESLQFHISSFKPMQEKYVNVREMIDEKISEAGLIDRLGEGKEVRSGENTFIVLKRAAFQELSLLRDMREYLSTQKNDEIDLTYRQNNLGPELVALKVDYKELGTFAKANTIQKVRDMVTEAVELNSIISGVTGLNLQGLNKNSICVQAVDMMELNFSLHDDRVINKSFKPIVNAGVTNPVWQSYANGAIQLLNTQGIVKTVKMTRDIPFALHAISSTLMQAKFIFEDASYYFERKLGSILSGSLKETDTSCYLNLSVLASFYSLTKRSKFDVTVSVNTFLSEGKSGTPKQEVRVDNVVRYFGDCPDNDKLEKVICFAGSKKAGIFSLHNAFLGVWKIM